MTDSNSTTRSFYLTDSEIQNNVLTIGSSTYFVYSGVAGQPVSLIAATGRTTETYAERVSMDEVNRVITHREFMELSTVGPAEQDRVLRVWNMNNDLAGFQRDGTEHMSAAELTSAMIAHVAMVRSQTTLYVAPYADSDDCL